jgi:hypothetical protein
MHPLKILILGLCIVFNQLVYSQLAESKKNEKKSIGIFISGGTHLALFHVFGMSLLPVQGQIDVKVDRKFFIGGAYSFDQFDFKDIGGFFNRENSFRHNARLRLFSYFNEPDQPFVGYAGGAVGASLWLNRQNQPINSPLIPTIQLFIGVKTKIYKRLFNIAELAMGAPYFIQTSFGYQF